ncbi:hypothetical protein [Brumimicrobium mesophilum]|uniref:hypothetical protein n=1 Tax=Brumimicrobium mesophilum TaxID=392717 RepID=UPI000D140A0F|nr:hypothetical protein [Brumimicrobium mesophilum]
MKFKTWHFFLVVFAFLIFLASGFGFKAGTMIASADKIIDSDIVENFYSSSWSVYTTIFGLFGIVLGVVFPLYQNNELKENMKKIEIEILNINKKNKEILKSHSIVNKILLLDKPRDLRDDKQWLAYLNKVSNVEIVSNLDAYLSMIEIFRTCLSMLQLRPEDEITKIITNKIEKEFPLLLSSNNNKEKVLNNTIDIWLLILDNSYNNNVEEYIELLENSFTNILGNAKSSEKELIKRCLLPEFRELIKERPEGQKYKQIFRIKKSETGKPEDVEIDMHTDKFWDKNAKEQINNFIRRLKEL